MLEKAIYKNHMNEVIELGKNGIYINENDLRDFSWDVNSRNDRISSFSKGIVEKTIPLIICCKSEEEGTAIKNHIFEVTEKDVLAKEPGRIIIGNYYLKCYITGSKKSTYLKKKGMMEVELSLTTDFPSWMKETTTVFNAYSGIQSEFLDYPFDYEYDFSSQLNNAEINNTGFVASDFRMIIYGFINNPTLYIDGHSYNVNVTVSDGEYLTIDSINKNIVLTRYNGEKVNCFNQRNKDSYIFEKIKPGTSIVTCEGELKADIVLMEERSEPKWT